ncbi:MAG: hypothetical protein LBC59_02670 [Chitinispirillales bacterium]|jgi:hypothetical protein|nr:hypothetical protein [Chitinispirillales bacterium]
MSKKITFLLLAFCCSALFAQGVQPIQKAQPGQPAPTGQPVTPAPTSPTAQAKRFLSVYVVGVTGEKERKVLGNEIMYALVKSGRCVPAERSNDFLDALAQEQKVTPRVSDLRIREIAKQFGVKFVCVAELTEVMNTFQLAARIVNIEAAEVEVVGIACNDLKSVDDFSAVTNKIMESMFAKKKGM